MATELPPHFLEDLEQRLEVPAPAIPADQQSMTSSVRQRRWDDPPEEEPAAPPENTTTMVFVKVGAMRPYLEAEIMQLAYSPGDSHLVAMAPKAINARTFRRDGVFGLIAWNAATGQRLPAPSGYGGSSYGVRLTGGFALKPAVDSPSSSSSAHSAPSSARESLVVACPFLLPDPGHESNGPLLGRLEIYDLARRVRLAKQDAPLCAPLAWSPDGELLAGVSMLEPSRVLVVEAPRPGQVSLRVVGVLLHHLDRVTQLAFLPASEEGGRALVSAGRDGFVRVTSVATG
ncbi:hypothetical protein VTH06DRAFT_3068, partial [Thermothelomyces fergusii]